MPQTKEDTKKEQNFSIGDVLALPTPEAKRLERTWTIAGRDWTIEIRADAMTRAEEFYKLINLSQRAMIECGGMPGLPKPEEPGLTVALPDPREAPIHIEDPGYLSQIYVLAEVSENPKFTPEEWVIFGHKIGDPTAFEEILDWASEANGVTHWMNKQVIKIKNALGASEPSKNGSGARVSGTRSKRRK